MITLSLSTTIAFIILIAFAVIWLVLAIIFMVKSSHYKRAAMLLQQQVDLMEDDNDDPMEHILGILDTLKTLKGLKNNNADWDPQVAEAAQYLVDHQEFCKAERNNKGTKILMINSNGTTREYLNKELIEFADMCRIADAAAEEMRDKLSMFVTKQPDGNYRVDDIVMTRQEVIEHMRNLKEGDCPAGCQKCEEPVSPAESAQIDEIVCDKASSAQVNPEQAVKAAKRRKVKDVVSDPRD